MKLINKLTTMKNATIDNPSWMASIVAALFLTACGGGASSSSQPDVSHPAKNSIQLYAKDIVARTAAGSPLVIDFTKNVVLSGRGEFRLTQLPELAKNSETSCQVKALNESKTVVSVSSDKVADCIFEYEVSSSTHASTPTRAYLRVGVSRDFSNNDLPNITKNLPSLAEVDIDVKAELVAQHPSITSADLAGFELQNEMVVFGEGHAYKKTDSTLRYMPTAQASYISVLFVLRKDDDIKFGTLLLSASDPTTGNALPVAQNYFYPEALEIQADGKTTELTFDLANTGDANVSSLIEDQDSTRLQLVNVQSMTSLVRSAAPNDFDNTRFIFQSSTPGWNDVIYTVSDHDGGYAIGTFSFYVEADYSLLQSWKDITINDSQITNNVTFLAPLTVTAADYLNIGYIDGQREGEIVGHPLVARLSYEQAETYCASRNARLPTPRELQTLNNQEGDLFSTHNWPKENSYWSTLKKGQTSATAYHLSEYNGNTVGSNENVNFTDSLGNTNARYVTCVALTEGVKQFTSRTSAVTDPVNGIKYDLETVLYDPDGAPAPFHFVTINPINKIGRFIPDQLNTGAKVYLDLNGKYQYSYIDHSFNNEIVQIRRHDSLLEEKQIFPQELNPPRVNFNASNWARGSYAGPYNSANLNISRFPINNRGIPAWNASYLPSDNNSWMEGRLINIFQQGFVGKSFMGRMKITQYGISAPRVGRLVFSLQQATSNNPNSVQGNNDFPGLTSDEKQLAIIYDYKNESLKVLNRRGDPDVKNTSISGLRQEYAYLWFIYSGSTSSLRVYAAPNDKRPTCPMKFGTDNHANIGWGSNMTVNNSTPYYLTLASYIKTKGNEPYANTVYFEYVDLTTWADTSLDPDTSEIDRLCSTP